MITAGPGQVPEAASGHLGGPLDVDHPEGGAQFPMILERIVSFRNLAPALQLEAVLVGEPVRCRRIGQVGNLDPEFPELLVQLVGLGQRRAVLSRQRPRPGDRCLPGFTLQPGDPAAYPILLGARPLGLRPKVPACLVDLRHRVYIEFQTPPGQGGLENLRLPPENRDIDHPAILRPAS